jgi:hypothetical protein
MQISFHPKAKKVLMLLGVIAIQGIVIFSVYPLLENSRSVGITSTSPDAQAAVKAATTFYTLDYTANPDLWATRLCALTTEAGCRIIHAFFAPSVQAMVQENKVQTGCTVVPVRLVSDKGHLRVWQVSVAIINPWPGLVDPKQDAFVEVENVNGLWLMNRILFQQEVSKFLTPTP